jgi:hypothetical protein
VFLRRDLRHRADYFANPSLNRAPAGGGLDGCRSMRQDDKLPVLAIGSLQTDVVLRIGPVDPGEGRKFNVRMWLHDFAPAMLK